MNKMIQTLSVGVSGLGFGFRFDMLRGCSEDDICLGLSGVAAGQLPWVQDKRRESKNKALLHKLLLPFVQVSTLCQDSFVFCWVQEVRPRSVGGQPIVVPLLFAPWFWPKILTALGPPSKALKPQTLMV